MTKAILASQQIVDALQKKPSSTECHELVRACEPRRQALRARLAAIEPSTRPHLVPDPAELVAATLKGPQAVLELQRERELLTVELEFMDRVEGMCHRAEAEARKAEARAGIPDAVKRLPRLVEHLRETMANFDAAISATQAALHMIGEFDNAGVEYPFNDDQLAELLELRHRAWRPRVLGVPHIVPMAMDDEPGPVGELVKKFPKSWLLLYTTYPGMSGSTLTTRKPPTDQSVVPAHYGAEPGLPRGGATNWPALDA